MIRKHIPDANTALCYSFDGDPAEGEYARLLDDAPGARHLTVKGAPGRVFSGVDTYARTFNAAENFGDRAIDTEAVAVLLGEWTIESWVKVDSLAAFTVILEVGADAETSATNFLIQLGIDTSGHVFMTWESGSGANTTFTAAAGGSVATGTWTHVAVTKTADGTGKYVLRVYVQGTLQGTSGALSNASGGTSTRWRLGSNVSAGFTLVGAARSVRLLSTPLDATAIAADAAIADRMHATDANTFVHWKLTEPAAIAVDGGYLGLDLVAETAAGVPYRSALVESGNSRYFDGSSHFAAAGPNASLLSLLTSGPWTMLVAIQTLQETPLPDFCAIASNGAVATDAPDVNYILASVKEDRRVNAEWESGAGTQHNVLSDPGALDDRGLPQHIVIRRWTHPTDGDCVDIFVDGHQVKHAVIDTSPSGGDASVFHLGAQPDGHNWRGYLDDFVLLDRALTDDEIGAYVVSDVAADTTPPIIGNFSPAPGSPVTPATALEFDATDETGLARVILVVTYPSGERELAFDAGGFTAPYAANSSRTEIAGGYRYSLRRTAGWPATPTLVPYVLDTSGNEVP